jgi:8-oxo-dGTP pyrophosphatase MutT (NUDIX family)
MKRVSAAGGIVLNERGEILIIFRRSKWDLPKGHLEKGETFEQCALREVKEETGLQNLSVVRFIGTTEHEYYDNFVNADVIKETQWFEMSASGNEPLKAQAEESIEWIRWIRKDELIHYLNNSYRNIIDIFKLAGLVSN